MPWLAAARHHRRGGIPPGEGILGMREGETIRLDGMCLKRMPWKGRALRLGSLKLHQGRVLRLGGWTLGNHPVA